MFSNVFLTKLLKWIKYVYVCVGFFYMTDNLTRNVFHHWIKCIMFHLAMPTSLAYI